MTMIKKRITERAIINSRICGIGMIIFTVLLVLFTWLGSENFTKIMGMSEMQNGHIDITSTNTEYIPLIGEKEFFYNKWIITDNEQNAAPDFMLDSQNRWTGKEINGEKLPRTGYGSYRWTMTALPGEPFIIHCVNFSGAYRVFINGDLYLEYGIMSKNPAETASNGIADKYTTYIPEKDELLTVVVEVSACKNGGLSTVMSYLRGEDRIKLGLYYGDPLVYIVIGALTMLILISLIINAGISKQSREWTLSVFLICLMMVYVFSLDMYRIIVKKNEAMIYNCISEVFYAFALILCIVFLLHLIKTDIIKFEKKHSVMIRVLIIINVICSVGYYCLIGYNERIITVFVQIILFSLLYFPLFRAAFNHKKYALLYAIILFGIIFALGTTFIDMLEFVNIATESVFSYSLIFIMIAVYVIYLLRIQTQNTAAVAAAGYQRRLVEIKSAVLREQIKPHFIFNCLASIQQIYHENIQTGDKALESFSRHLRANVDACEKEMVSFEKEIENVLNYIYLEELRTEKSINLLLDINYWDFDIPVLALQPFVENSVKYSGIVDSVEGYILIKTIFEKDQIVIEIEDNGKGFNINEIGSGSVGLKNSKERLFIMLGADTKIVSKLHEGTKIIITFPAKNHSEDK